jgi:hypothetical protein
VRRGPGPWAWAAIAIASLLVVSTAVTRFRYPIGEKHFSAGSPGGLDFQYPFNGARGLMMGIDPYLHPVPRLADDPWRDDPVPSGRYHQFYPPSHLLVYVPLAWLANDSFEDATRFWFDLNLLWLVLISLIAWRLLPQVQGGAESWLEGVSPAVGLLMLFLLSTNQAVALSLDRGQSDVFGAFLCWWAVRGWLRGERASPVFLAVAATLMKGYSALFAAGLGLLGLADPRSRLPVIAGGAAAIALLLGPVARLVPQGLAATSLRANMFANGYLNQSYENVAYNLSPDLARPGRVVLVALAIAGTSLAWAALLKASRGPATPALVARWLVLFTTAALATMLGASGLSVPYNLILVLPGALLLILAQDDFVPGASGLARGLLGLGLCVLAFLLFVFDVGSPNVCPSGYALLGLPALAGALAWPHLRSRPVAAA